MKRVYECISSHMQVIRPGRMLDVKVELLISLVIALGNGCLKIRFADCFFPIEHHGDEACLNVDAIMSQNSCHQSHIDFVEPSLVFLCASIGREDFQKQNRTFSRQRIPRVLQRYR